MAHLKEEKDRAAWIQVHVPPPGEWSFPCARRPSQNPAIKQGLEHKILEYSTAVELDFILLSFTKKLITFILLTELPVAWLQRPTV